MPSVRFMEDFWLTLVVLQNKIVSWDMLHLKIMTIGTGQGVSEKATYLLIELHVYPRTPNSSEGLIPRAIICYMGIDPYVLFF